VSGVVYDAGFRGIHYRSKYGHDIENWALFEPFQLEPAASFEIRADDADLIQALQTHRLRLEDVGQQ